MLDDVEIQSFSNKIGRIANDIQFLQQLYDVDPKDVIALWKKASRKKPQLLKLIKLIKHLPYSNTNLSVIFHNPTKEILLKGVDISIL